MYNPNKKILLSFIILFLIFIIHQVILKAGIIIPIFSNYLDDLLCIPISMSIALLIHQKVIKNVNYRFNWLHILMSILFFSLIFELILPFISTRFHGDPFDIFVYILGGIIFKRILL